MVQAGGLEPPRDCSLRILSPLRIPFRHACAGWFATLQFRAFQVKKGVVFGTFRHRSFYYINQILIRHSLLHPKNTILINDE